MLYYFANAGGGLVVGTGNKVEDFGVGFFTKFGDGGVDISPIADLLKSEVRELASYLEVPDFIVEADPTDGLWEDGRNDENQLGMTYEEIEMFMEWKDKPASLVLSEFTKEEIEKLREFTKMHKATKHKLEMPPICKLRYDDE